MLISSLPTFFLRPLYNFLFFNISLEPIHIPSSYWFSPENILQPQYLYADIAVGNALFWESILRSRR